jgi:exosortase/archaeosortase family protein
MSSAALPTPRSRARHRAAHRAGPRPSARRRPGFGESSARRFTRLATAVTLLGLAAAIPFQDGRTRDFEAWLASHVIPVLGVQAGYLRGSSMAWFAERTDLRIGLIVTPECTIALLICPFLVATALLVWRRAPLVRTLIGAAIATALLEVLNQARLLSIVALVRIMGYPTGFYWGHTMFGSVLLVVGLTAIFALFAFLAVRRGASGRTR